MCAGVHNEAWGVGGVSNVETDRVAQGEVVSRMGKLPNSRNDLVQCQMAPS